MLSAPKAPPTATYVASAKHNCACTPPPSIHQHCCSANTTCHIAAPPPTHTQTHTRPQTPPACAMSASAGRSATTRVGLDTLSQYTTWGAGEGGRAAAAAAATAAAAAKGCLYANHSARKAILSVIMSHTSL
jgi:hypothetical protein